MSSYVSQNDWIAQNSFQEIRDTLLTYAKETMTTARQDDFHQSNWIYLLSFFIKKLNISEMDYLHFQNALAKIRTQAPVEENAWTELQMFLEKLIKFPLSFQAQKTNSDSGYENLKLCNEYSCRFDLEKWKKD